MTDLTSDATRSIPLDSMTEIYFLQDIIGKAILEQKSHIVLRKDTGQDDVRKAIRLFMREHPEIFWFSHQYRFDESTSELYLKYNFNASKRQFYAKEIDNAVRFLFQPERLENRSDLEKVTYVYKWIAKNTTYNDNSSFNQTIYSVLINRNSVCTGYAKTAQYLLGTVGLESKLIFGKLNVDLSADGRHAWNIVKINGEWYHVDFCLADVSLKHLLYIHEKPIEYEGLLWNYFCKPTESILKNRSIEFIESYPECVKSIDKWPDIGLPKPLKQMAVCKSDSGTTAKIYLNSFNKKQVIKTDREDHRLIVNEYDILNRLNGCKHIISMTGYNENGLELEQLTPWSELLNSHYYQPNEKELIKILIQLTEGLIECINHGITYSDIHYNNVFVTKDGIYKWGDFGYAYPPVPNGTMPPNLIGHDGIAIGARWFMAPETYKDHLFTESSAVYSLAMLAYFVMNGMRPPYWDEKKDTEEILRTIYNQNSNIPSPKSCNNEFWEFLKGTCLCYNKSSRLSTLDVFLYALKHEVFYSNSEQVVWGLRTGIYRMDSNTPEIPLGRGPHVLPGASPRYRTADNGEYDTDSFARTCGGLATTAPLASNDPEFGPKTKRGLNLLGKFSNVFKRRNKQTKQGNDNTPSGPNDRISYHPGISDSKGSSATGGIPDGLETSAEFSSGNEPTIRQNINACLYAPAEVSPNKSFIVRVYMYLSDEQLIVESKIREIDSGAVKKDYKPLDLPVKTGDKLTIRLELSDGVQCKNSIKQITWKNRFEDCSFIVKLVDEHQEGIDGTAYIFVNDMPAGEMIFTIDVVQHRPREACTKIETHRFSKIFISYAHQDENQVRGIAEGCKMLGKDYFFDRHTLQPGDIFKEKILNYINDADLFVLCWSKNAAESEWVRIEREHAMRLIREGKSSLSIYPLSIRPEAPLPLDMSDKYNFGKL